MACLACWLYTSEPLAVAQAPQPPTTAIRVLKGAEPATSYFQEGHQADTKPSFILIKGAERSEWSFPSDINEAPIIPRRSLPASRSRVRTVSGAGGTGHDEAKGGLADVPSLSTAAKPTQEKSKPLSTTGLGQAPLMEKVLAPGGLDLLRKPGQEQGESSGSFLYKIELVHMINNLAAMSLGLILFAGLFFLLRRFGQQLETFSRLQFVNPRVSGEPDRWLHSTPERDTHASADASSTFDLGPTYSEEMQLKDEAAREQEDAVLRQVFEQNLQLRAQIGALSTVNT
jgi:hypothetical protein